MPGDDFFTAEYSGSGDVTAPCRPSTWCCRRERTASTPTAAASPRTSPVRRRQDRAPAARHVRLLVKAQNAVDAGAAGVIIFNEGQEGRTGVPEPAPSATPLTPTGPRGRHLLRGRQRARRAARGGVGIIHLVTETLDRARRADREPHRRDPDGSRRPGRDGRRAPRLGARRPRHQRQRHPVRQPRSRSRFRWPTSASSRATRSGSHGGAPRRPAWSGRSSTSTR